jgi:cellulose biosynthesis protein BcsQ
MRIYATYNIKGGVGKTTTAVNLAYLAAESGLRTVLWDLDPQGAASFMFRVKPKVKGGGRALISGKRPLDDAIKGTDFDNLDLIPADFTYRPAARPAEGRVRRRLPRLPAVRLAGLGERAARGRRHRRPAHPDDALRADA